MSLFRNHYLLTTTTLMVFLLFSGCGEKKEKATNDSNHQKPNKEEPKVTTPKTPGKEIQDKQLETWANMDGILGMCGGEKSNLAVPVNLIAQNISRDSLAYDVEPFSDCSGIFLRLLDSLNTRCPGNNFPDPRAYRDSRALAKWYHKQKLLIRVSDPLKMTDHLKPGTVMFYGARGADAATLTLDDLFQHGGINHVGVITELERNKKGDIVGYSLFHGQRPGKLASITKYHKRKYRNRKDYPPFGNGSEQWVAVAPIVKSAP